MLRDASYSHERKPPRPGLWQPVPEAHGAILWDHETRLQALETRPRVTLPWGRAIGLLSLLGLGLLAHAWPEILRAALRGWLGLS
jgi:hypothetical protein